MVYFFNELSVSAVNSRARVCEVMETFVRTHVKAKDAGIDDLRLHEKALPNLYKLNLYDSYNLDNWLNDSRINSDLQDNFRLITTSSPLIKESDIIQVEEYSRSEFFKLLEGHGYQVWGLGATHIYDTISFSLNTHDEWEKASVEIKHYYLDEHANENQADRVVRHFSTIETLEVHIDWYENYRLENLKKASEIWDSRKEHFPNLSFTGDTEKQFRGIGDFRTMAKICDALFKLDRYMKGQKSGRFNYEDAIEKTGVKMSPESASTIQKFGAQRTFTIPLLGRKLFDLHIKLGETRIHFYPIEETQTAYIGYIGKHLRISSED